MNPEEIAQQTENLIKKLIESGNESRNSLIEESDAVIRGVNQLAENCLKEKQHASAVQLHVEQLEKLIARLRNERDVHISPGGTNRPAKVTVLESELATLQLELEESNEKIVFVTTILEEKDNIIIQLQEELEKRNTELAGAVEALLATRDQFAESQLSVETRDAKFKSANELNAKLEEDIRVLTANFAAFQEEASQKTEQLNAEIAQRQAAVDELSANLANNAVNYHDLLEQFDTHMKDGISVFADHVSDSLGALIRGNVRLLSLQQSVTLIHQALVERNQHISFLTANLKNTEIALETSLNESRSLQESLLQKDDELLKVQQFNSELDKALADLLNEKQSLVSALAEKESELQTAIADLDAVRSNAEMVADGFQTISEKLDHQKDLVARLQENVTSEQSKCTELEQSLWQRDEEIEQHKGRIIELQTLLNENEAKIKGYEQRIVEISSSAHGSEEGLIAKNNELEHALEGKNNEISLMKALFEAEKTEWHQKHEGEMSVLQHEIDTFQLRIKEIDQILPELHFQLTEAQRDKVSLKDHSEKLQVLLAESEQAVQQVKLELAEKERQISSSASESVRLRSQCEHLQARLELLTQQLVERNSEVDELGSRVLQLEKEIEFSGNQMTSSQSETAKQLATLEVARQEAEFRLAEELKEKSAVQEALRVAELSVQGKVSEIDDLKMQLAQITAEREQTTQDLRVALAEQHKLQDMLVQRTSTDDEISGEILDLQKRLESEVNNATELRTLNSDMEERIRQLSDELGNSYAVGQGLQNEKSLLSTEVNASAERNRFLESEISRLSSLVASFMQFVDSNFINIRHRLDNLIRRYVSFHENAKGLVTAHNSAKIIIADVKVVFQNWAAQQDPMFHDFISTIKTAMAHLESRVIGAQTSFVQLAAQMSAIRANSESLENSLRNEISSLSSQLSSKVDRPVTNGYCQTAAVMVDISELEALQDVLDRRDAEIDQLMKDVKRLSFRPRTAESEVQTNEKLIEPIEIDRLNSFVSDLQSQVASRDDQLRSFSQELQMLQNERSQQRVEFERHIASTENHKRDVVDGYVQTTENVTSREEVEQLHASLAESQNHLMLLDQQLQAANQQIRELVEEVKSYRDVAKRAERRFNEADAAAKSLAADGQNMAAIVQSLREKLRSTEDRLSATEIARVQVTNQLTALQTMYSSMPNPEQSNEVAAECDRLRNKVKFMTEQFELAVSRSALLERSLREKEEQCERLARELGLERQRILTFEKETTPPNSGMPSPGRESPLSDTRVDLRQYYEALPVPVKRAFDRVRHSQAAVVTVSASQRFRRIVDKLPVSNAIRQFSISARHRVLSRLSPARVQLIVTVYVCFLHLLTIFYFFTCYGPPGVSAGGNIPPHVVEQPDDMRR